MFNSRKLFALFIFPVVCFLAFSVGRAQEKPKNQMPSGKPVLWEPVNISERDLFSGPGGPEMRPDLRTVTFIKEETNGHNKKYRIRDASGRVWVAKIGREAQPETVAVRLLWGLGFKTEINYLVNAITIPGKGTFENVRLEARPENVKRLDEWKWKQNPFTGTNEFQALKIMMVFLNNWDIVDVQNKVLLVEGQNGPELHYIISDLGATFGRLGNNNLPVIYRLGRKVNNPSEYLASEFVKGVEGNLLKLAYKGKNRDLFDGITVEQGRWLADLLNQLSDKQISDMFWVANYEPAERKILVQAVKNKIKQLNDAVK
jgi:hypothetical protein